MAKMTQTYEQLARAVTYHLREFLEGRLEVGSGEYINGFRDDRECGPDDAAEMERMIRQLASHLDEVTGTNHRELFDEDVEARSEDAELPCISFVWASDEAEFHLILNSRDKAPWACTDVCARLG